MTRSEQRVIKAARRMKRAIVPIDGAHKLKALGYRNLTKKEKGLIRKIVDEHYNAQLYLWKAIRGISIKEKK